MTTNDGDSSEDDEHEEDQDEDDSRGLLGGRGSGGPRLSLAKALGSMGFCAARGDRGRRTPARLAQGLAGQGCRAVCGALQGFAGLHGCFAELPRAKPSEEGHAELPGLRGLGSQGWGVAGLAGLCVGKSLVFCSLSTWLFCPEIYHSHIFGFLKKVFVMALRSQVCAVNSNATF